MGPSTQCLYSGVAVALDGCRRPVPWGWRVRQWYSEVGKTVLALGCGETVKKLAQLGEIRGQVTVVWEIRDRAISCPGDLEECPTSSGVCFALGRVARQEACRSRPFQQGWHSDARSRGPAGSTFHAPSLLEMGQAVERCLDLELCRNQNVRLHGPSFSATSVQMRISTQLANLNAVSEGPCHPCPQPCANRTARHAEVTCHGVGRGCHPCFGD